jgi:putative thioredoxin
VVSELLRVAAANGVTGRIDFVGGPEQDEPVPPVEEPLPAHLRAAYDAIDAGDLAGAVVAYETALKENPADEEARLGLAHVRLFERAQNVNPAVARAAAAKDPQDIDAQLIVADLDVLGGHVEDAFARLVDAVRRATGPERERIRQHLIELFGVVGTTDPRVASARLALANALF